ncbi:MAG: hypothetical protein GQ574_10085 [Crocinitomix sp.]|nr:hypothetical protein [Crocinitomix sp.]
MFAKKIIHIILILFAVGHFSSCGTYYDKSVGTEKALIQRDYVKAEDAIVKNKFLTRKRNELLYYLELGKVLNLQGKFAESNYNLNKADYMMEAYRSVFDMALGVTVNPALQSYKAEPHERILVHYYKALNYLQLGDIEEAIVEARRIDLSEMVNNNAVNGKFKKYGKDPFGLILMGMIYEADQDYNNAFIAYRNAKDVYNNDETGLYNGKFPESLERDLVRTSAYAGMSYQSDLEKVDLPHGEAIIFWEKGLAPIKAEKNIFFSLNQKNGSFFFMSDNLSIPIDYNFAKNDPDFDPSDIGMIRLAIPYYVQRVDNNLTASITVNDQQKKFTLIEDIDALAFQIEKDNYLKELGKNLLRLALKKISELAINERNPYAGLALNIANVATEKADTRNWQSLPSQIHYARIPLQEGLNKITVNCSNGQTKTFEIRGSGRKVFRNVVSY